MENCRYGRYQHALFRQRLESPQWQYQWVFYGCFSWVVMKYDYLTMNTVLSLFLCNRHTRVRLGWVQLCTRCHLDIHWIPQNSVSLYNSPMEQPFAERTQEKMREVLMDSNADGPAIHYYMIRGGEEKLNITVMETGTVGGEYIKTYGHYHVFDFKETYKIIHGRGLVLLQIREKDASGNFRSEERRVGKE